jgi:uncharacterized protein
MKFSLETISDKNFIASYDSDHVVVKNELESVSQHIGSNVIISSEKIIQFSQQLELEIIFQLAPELVIVTADYALASSNISQIKESFLQRSIGFEMMGLGAACRTYNLLIAEDRNVVLIVEFSEQ